MRTLVHVRRAVNVGNDFRIQLIRRTIEHLDALLQRNDAVGILDGVVNLVQIHQACNAQLIGHPTKHFHRHA